MRRIVTALAPALLVVLLGACADGAGQPGESPSPTAPPTGSPTTPAPTSSPTPTPTPPQPTVSPPADKDVQTLSGEVFEGVESSCQLIRADSTEYLLVWQGGQFRTGDTITVRGYAEPDLATTCMQGTPFVVTEVLDD